MNRLQNASGRLISNTHQEEGAALIVSLLLLLIVTILAVSMSSTSILEQKMTANARDKNAAFEATEAALRGGEAALIAAANTGTVTLCANLSNCNAAPILGFSNTDLANQPKSWWDNNAVEYGTAGTKDLTNIKEDPRYITSLRAIVKDSLTKGGGSNSKVTNYYEITVHGYGITDTAESVTSAIIAIPEH